MSTDKAATAKLDRILAEAQRSREEGYRDKALKMYPHVCGRCAREFSGKRLSELTVHHRDHNHDNEHARYTDQQYFSEGSTASQQGPKSTHKAFADLAALLKSKE